MFSRSRPRSAKSNIADDVAVPDDTFMTDFKNFSLQNTVANIEGQIDSGDLPLDEDDDVLPQAAADMGTGVFCAWNYFTYIFCL